MSQIKTDLSTFLTSIDGIIQNLEPSRRPQDSKVPDCSPKQLSTLRALSQHGRISMSHLANAIDVPISTATRLVDQLVSKKLLCRMPSPEDARKVEVDFSPLGKEINDYIDQTRQGRALSLLSKLSEKERITFLNQLSSLTSTTPLK